MMTRQNYLPLMSLQFGLAIIVSLHHGAIGDVTSNVQNADSSSGNAQSLLRVRRQGENFVRFARAPSSFVRIGKMNPSDLETDHREGNEGFMRSDRVPAMNRFIRIGRPDYTGNAGPDDGVHEESDRNDWLYSKIKRSSSFVRIGKSVSDGEFPESSPFNKRGPGFVRIGKDWGSKRPSGFVRIGKDFGDDEESDDDEDKDIFQDKRAPGFVRIGKASADSHDSAENGENKRGNFVRIGKSDASLFNSDIEDEHFDKDGDDDVEKRAPGFVRIGKSGDDVEDKRGSGFVRIGKDGDDIMDKRAPGFVRIGKALDEEMTKRAPGFVRIGKSIDDNLLHKRAPGFVRIGKNFDEDMSKRAPGFVRIGKALNDELLHKRAPGFVRIGKDLDEEMLKRAPGFVRIGKSLDDRFHHKRGSGFVRIGKSNFYDMDDSGDFMPHQPQRSIFADGFDTSLFENELVKKSPGFVRIGKSDFLDSADVDKRPSGFVRIGKSLLHSSATNAVDDRDMMKKSPGFVRIGKQAESDNAQDSLLSNSASISGERVGDAGGSRFQHKNPINVSRRGSAFVRIGKIPSAAFVPLNKDIGRLFDVKPGKKAGYRRRSRNGQSSFVRIG